MDTTTLQSAFEALRSYLSGQQLYQDAPTTAFNRAELSRLFTAYYDAEAQTLCEIGAARGDAAASSALDEMAQSIGYDNYSQMASGEVLIKDGKIRADLIDTDQLVARSVEVVDSNKNSVMIKPNEGLKLLQNGAVTATFTGSKVGSLAERIPINTNIILKEALLERVPISRNGKTSITLASGIVNASASVPVNLTIPELVVMANVKFHERQLRNGGTLSAHPEILPPEDRLVCDNHFPITVTAQLLINGDVCTWATNKVESLNVVMQHMGTAADGSPIFARVLDVNTTRKGVLQPLTLTYSKNTSLKIELVCRVEAPSDFYSGEGEWIINAAIRRAGVDLFAKPLIEEPLAINGKTFNAAFYGNALLFSHASNQYVGIAAPDNGDTELLIRSNRNGFRCDGSGQLRWSHKLQAWIPADGVLYRAYDPKGGTTNPRQWSYNGKKLSFGIVREGSLWVSFPEFFSQVSDYFVRVDQVIMDWHGTPTIVVESNQINGFQLSTYTDSWFWHGFMFEVLYTGDWW